MMTAGLLIALPGTIAASTMTGLTGQTVAAMATPAKKAKVAWAKVVKLFLKPLGYMCVHTSPLVVLSL